MRNRAIVALSCETASREQPKTIVEAELAVFETRVDPGMATRENRLIDQQHPVGRFVGRSRLAGSHGKRYQTQDSTC